MQDHGPFAPDLIEAAQEELAEASGMLDLSEHRLDHLLAQPVTAAPPGSPQPLGHRASGVASSAFGAPRRAPRRGALGPAPGSLRCDAAPR